MLATEMLTEHHDLLRTLLADIADSLGSNSGRNDRRRVTALMDELTDELTLHEMIEDAIFYPAMSDTSAMVPIAHSEHRQISDQLATVLRTPAGSDRFATEFAALRVAVEQHAAEEEQQMFRDAERRVPHDELERMGEQLTAELARLRGSRLTRLRLRAKRAVMRHTPSFRRP
jgi:hypothetical protein